LTLSPRQGLACNGRKRKERTFWVASTRQKIRCYEEADGLFAEIERRIGQEFLMGKRAALWHTCANDSPQIDCEALRFLKHPASPTRGIRVYRMSAVRVVSLFHTGVDQTIPQAYHALQAWLGRNGLFSRGPKCEIYWSEPAEGREGEALTEIRLPVFPNRNRAVRKPAPREGPQGV
jgi:effector-binding domain-containing protein